MLFTSVAVQLNAEVRFFLTFREVLLIGGENVKTQVQQLNEGVSSQRDSLSQCMCTNNHTFSKQKFKKKKQLPVKYCLFSLPEYSSISKCKSLKEEARGH